MDQVKDILNKLIQYRFWIAVGLAIIIPMAGFFVAHGSITEETTKKAAEIKSASEGVKPFTSGEVKNQQFIAAVKEKTEVLSRNVDESWRTLYDRQAPLLDWPESVGDYFPKWGRVYPADIDANEISRAREYYIRDYDDYVDKVYATIRPFDYEEGTGVVVAPPKEALLNPSTFSITKLPSLSDVWDAQEKLWLQRTVLDVLNQVNRNAKDWESAKVKQIFTLTVGNAAAQDQISRVAAQELVKSPDLTAEGGEGEVDAGGGDAGMGMGGAPGGSEMEAMMSGGYGGYGGAGGPGGGAADPKAPIMYISTESTQFRLFPIHVKVLVDQNYIPELLSAFQNSPMTIDVREIRIQRPEQRVTKPKKGEQNPFGGMMGMGGYGGYGSDMGMEGMGGYGMFGGGRGGMMEMPGMGGYGGMGSSEGMAGMMGGYGGYGGMGGAAVPKRTGVDLRGERDQLKKKAGDKKDEGEKAEPKFEIYDPYYDLVVVDIYGQARIYSAPPEPEVVETTAEEAAAEPMTEGEPADPATPAQPEAAPADAPAGDEPKAADAPTPAPAGDEPKADAPKAEEPAKAEDPEPKR